MLIDLLALIMVTCSVPSQGGVSKEGVLTCRQEVLSCIAENGVDPQPLIFCTGMAQNNLLKGVPSAQPTPAPTQEPTQKVRNRMER